MDLQYQRGAGELVSLAQLLLRNAGVDALTLSLNAESNPDVPQRVKAVLKASIGGVNTASPGWTDGTYHQLVSGFLESLRSISAFDRMLMDGAIRRAPLRARFGVTTVQPTAGVVAEAAPKPTSGLTLDLGEITPVKASSIIVVTGEMLRLMDSAAAALLSGEMRNAVAQASDAVFLVGLLDHAVAHGNTVASTGSAAADALADIRTLLAIVSPRATSKLYLVTGTEVAQGLATQTTSSGAIAFPGMTPTGGEIQGVPVLVTDQMPTTSDGSPLMLVDASRIAGDTEGLTMVAADSASVQMSDSPGASATSLVSMFETSARALRIERFLGWAVLTDNAVAVIAGTNYGTTLS
jgi:HK97 family phage major capsid protein